MVVTGNANFLFLLFIKTIFGIIPRGKPKRCDTEDSGLEPTSFDCRGVNLGKSSVSKL
jgi:hypothetical protein